MAQATRGAARRGTEPEAAAAVSSAVRSVELEHLGEMAQRARTAFELARDAFVRLEVAHHEGRPGVEENATFRAKVVLFREAAKAVHQAAAAAHGATTGFGG